MIVFAISFPGDFLVVFQIQAHSTKAGAAPPANPAVLAPEHGLACCACPSAFVLLARRKAEGTLASSDPQSCICAAQLCHASVRLGCPGLNPLCLPESRWACRCVSPSSAPSDVTWAQNNTLRGTSTLRPDVWRSHDSKYTTTRSECSASGSKIPGPASINQHAKCFCHGMCTTGVGLEGSCCKQANIVCHISHTGDLGVIAAATQKICVCVQSGCARLHWLQMLQLGACSICSAHMHDGRPSLGSCAVSATDAALGTPAMPSCSSRLCCCQGVDWA